MQLQLYHPQQPVTEFCLVFGPAAVSQIISIIVSLAGIFVCDVAEYIKYFRLQNSDQYAFLFFPRPPPINR